MSLWSHHGLIRRDQVPPATAALLRDLAGLSAGRKSGGGDDASSMSVVASVRRRARSNWPPTPDPRPSFIAKVALAYPSRSALPRSSLALENPCASQREIDHALVHTGPRAAWVSTPRRVPYEPPSTVRLSRSCSRPRL